MKKSIPHPHDSLVKAAFTNPQDIQGMLEAVLPPKVSEQIHWPSLHKESETLINPELDDYYTDLLFSCRLKKGRKAYLYFLVEHLSSPRLFVICTLLRYMVEIWTQWAKEHPKAKKLPLILPVVVYHDKKPWTAPTSFHEIIQFDPESKDAFAEFIPSFRFLLDDLTRISDQDVRSRHISAMGQLTLFVLRDARHHAHFIKQLEKIMDLIQDLQKNPHWEDSLSQILEYIYQVCKDVFPEQVVELFQQHHVGKQAEELAMTVAEQLEQRGYKKEENISGDAFFSDNFVSNFQRCLVELRIWLKKALSLK